VLTAQSNISNSKIPLSVTEYASSLGYHTVVDGAALAATSILNLSDYPIDAMAVSFYKMFGYPTGVGALIIKTAFLAQLKRPWFAGGTVDVVQVPGNIVTRARQPHEQFEVCRPLSDIQHLVHWACFKIRMGQSTTFNCPPLPTGCASYQPICRFYPCGFRASFHT
jgi:hypothetical protein